MKNRRTTDRPLAPQPQRPWAQRLWAQRSLAQQQAAVALAAGGLLALLLLAWPPLAGLGDANAPWAPALAALAAALVAAAAAAALAQRHGRALLTLAEAARQLRRDDAPDELNLPLIASADELQLASTSLRRMVDAQRALRQALQARNAALGQQLQQRAHELTTLQDLSAGLASGQDLFELVEEALKALEQTLEYSSASLWARDRRRDSRQVVLMGYRIGQDNDEPELALTNNLRGQRLSRPNLQRYEEIERTREPVIDNQVHQGLLSWLWEKVTDDASTSALYRGSRAWMGVPLNFRDEVLGVMRVDHRQPGYFSADRARLLTAVCHQTALAMHHAQLLVQQRDLAVMAERNRIARDLHDAVSQTLFAAHVLAGTLAKLAARPEFSQQPDGPALLAQARAMERLNRGALAEMRLLMFELRPDALQHAALAELLKPVIEALECRGDIRVSQQIATAEDLPPPVRLQLYRMAQEALSNAARHSGASEVTVQWQPLAEDGARLCITDNGQGFDPSQPRHGHFGLDNLHSRAAEIGAALQITSLPGQGTSVCVLLATGPDSQPASHRSP